MDGWNTSFRPIFRCYVSFREGSELCCVGSVCLLVLVLFACLIGCVVCLSFPWLFFVSIFIFMFASVASVVLCWFLGFGVI